MKNLEPFISNLEELVNQNFFKRKEDFYLSFRIFKKSGTFRWIDSPREPLKSIQKEILYNIIYKFRPHRCCIGFRKNIGVQEGAKRHFGNQCLLNMDLKDFFPSVKDRHLFTVFYRINAVLESKGYKPLTKQEVCLLVKTTSYFGKLPQGAPTSPALANLAALGMDKKLYKLAQDFGLEYTRYADDISFSHPDKKFDIGRLIPAITLIVESEGFFVNKKKTRVARPHQRMCVTGVVINDRLTVPRRDWRNFRAKLHNLVRDNKSITKKEYQKLRGYIEWVNSVHPKKAQQFQKKLGQLSIQKP